jgi:dihydroorotate dehydrogenase electron transfer subunit
VTEQPRGTGEGGPRGDRGPVRVTAEVLGSKRAGAYHHLTAVAPGVAERFRPGTFVAVAVGGAHTDRLGRRAFFIHRARPTGAYGGTVEIVVDPVGSGSSWVAGAQPGSRLDLLGPLGRPFALPKEPVACLLVGDASGAAPLFALAERLRTRRCVVHMLLGAETEAGLLGTLEARRTARSVTVATADGSVGIRGTVLDALPQVLGRSAADVVYAGGPAPVLHAVARMAEDHGIWSQTAVTVPMPCGTGVCLGCMVPVVGAEGVEREVRACVEGPVFRGDRVRWRDLVEAGSPRRGTSGGRA